MTFGKGNVPKGGVFKGYVAMVEDWLASDDLSKARAIKLKCIECVGCEDVVPRVRECTCKRCPLWRVRPYQDKAEATEESIPT